MAAILKPLGNVLLTSDSTAESGAQQLYDVNGASPLLSVIVTNTTDNNGTVKKENQPVIESIRCKKI